MAYAALSDIQDEFKGIVTFNSTSSVKDTVITRFITEAEAEINGRVGLVYTVPVDSIASPISFSLLRSLSIGIVVTRVKNIMEVKSADTNTAQGSGSKTDADNARKILQQIVDQTLHLVDGVKKSLTDGVKSFAQGETHPLVFQKDCRQW